jgi:biotin carboxyl carrier protein
VDDAAVLDPGEDLLVLERVVVAPTLGVFRPLHLESHGTGTLVRVGDVVGTIVRTDAEHPIRSRFTGVLMGILAHDGERVREGAPVAWLRLAS